MKRAAAILLLAALPALAAEAPWQDVRYEHFENLQPLSGQWAVEDGVLIGRAAEGEMAWMRSTEEFADFELELEFKTPVACNGGVQFRSHILPVLPAAEGVPAQELPTQMYGYQANIETRSEAGTASLIDENGRGLLTGPSVDAQKTVKATDWNTMHIAAEGAVIEVAVNGVIATRVEDEAMLKGILALQVSPLEGAPAEIQFRNIRIRDLDRTGAWRPLFNGADLDGWTRWGTEEWSVENGIIVGRSGPDKSEGYLATNASWKDFRVRGAFKMLGAGNFGLFYHSTIRYNDKNYPLISGVQGEVEPSYPGSTGWHYESYRRGWIIPPDKKQLGAYALRPDQWNEIEIRSVGNHITSWVNGFRVTDFYDAAPQVFAGGFALQLHAGGVDGIMWKDLFVESPPLVEP